MYIYFVLNFLVYFGCVSLEAALHVEN